MTVPLPSARPEKAHSSGGGGQSTSRAPEPALNDGFPLLMWDRPNKGRSQRLAFGFFIKFVCPLLVLFILCLNNFYGPGLTVMLHTWPIDSSWRTMMTKWEAVHGPFVREYYFDGKHDKYLQKKTYEGDRQSDQQTYPMYLGDEDNLPNPPAASNASCAAVGEVRFDCFPRGTVTEQECVDRGCCYQESAGPIPSCFYPQGYASYDYTSLSFSDGVVRAEMSASFKSPYPKQFAKMFLLISHIGPDTVVFEYSPTPFPTGFKSPALRMRRDRLFGKFDEESSSFKIDISADKSGFRIIRKSNNRVLFDTTSAGILFSEQFAQISTLLPSKYIYGLEQQANSFPLDTNWNTITLFNHDIPPTKTNGYGFYPAYLCMEGDGRAHFVEFGTEVATDFRIQPNGLTMRTISGKSLYVAIFLGESPKAVYENRKKTSGLPPVPPFWALGFHFSRFGFKDTANMKNTWSRIQQAKIPFDTIWTDIDYMNERNDFTLSPKFQDLPKFVNELHKEGMHYVLIIDPGVSGSEPRGTYPPYDKGMALDIFVKDSYGKKPLIGKVWNSKTTVFPDFTNPKTLEYWIDLVSKFYQKLEFDGIWLDMNEPSNFVNGSIAGCPKDDLENPPYVPGVDGGVLNYHTLCMTAKHFAGEHYFIHSSHAHSEVVSTSFALQQIRKERPFVLTRSGNLLTPEYSAMWTGDVWSTWDDMKQSVRDILTFNLLGQSLVGADICGFNGNTTKSLCHRWSQLGAFYPFSRNHNTDDGIDQDPVALGIQDSTRDALNMRYELLPYLYTLFFIQYHSGHPVVRPTFYEVPEDVGCYTVDTQFFWGDALLIIPNLEESISYVKAYIGTGVWYDLATLQRISATGTRVVLPASDNEVAILVRGGSIIPSFNVNGAVTTKQLREAGSLSLRVGLNDTHQAIGHFYWDDGITVDPPFTFGHFYAEKGRLESHMYVTNYKDHLRVDTIRVMDVEPPVTKVTLDGQPCNFSYNDTLRVLIVEPRVSVYHNFTVLWS